MENNKTDEQIHAVSQGIVDMTGRALKKAGWKEAKTPEEKRKKGRRLWLILLIGFVLWLIIGILMHFLYK